MGRTCSRTNDWHQCAPFACVSNTCNNQTVCFHALSAISVTASKKPGLPALPDSLFSIILLPKTPSVDFQHRRVHTPPSLVWLQIFDASVSVQSCPHMMVEPMCVALTSQNTHTFVTPPIAIREKKTPLCVQVSWIDDCGATPVPTSLRTRIMHGA